jgi:hypothetical protein
MTITKGAFAAMSEDAALSAAIQAHHLTGTAVATQLHRIAAELIRSVLPTADRLVYDFADDDVDLLLVRDSDGQVIWAYAAIGAHPQAQSWLAEHDPDTVVDLAGETAVAIRICLLDADDASPPAASDEPEDGAETVQGFEFAHVLHIGQAIAATPSSHGEALRPTARLVADPDGFGARLHDIMWHPDTVAFCDGDYGWDDGGCLLLAEALMTVLDGAQLWAIVANGTTVAEHYLVRHGDWFVDAHGVQTAEQVLQSMQTAVVQPILVPAAQATKHPDTPEDSGVSHQLAARITTWLSEQPVTGPAITFDPAGLRAWISKPSIDDDRCVSWARETVDNTAFGTDWAGEYLSLLGDLLAEMPRTVWNTTGAVNNVGVLPLFGDGGCDGARVSVELANGLRLVSPYLSFVDFANPHARSIEAAAQGLSCVARAANDIVTNYHNATAACRTP